MKALTVLQPWATCIALHGKNVENREWRPLLLKVGERFAIHAGARFDHEGWKSLRTRLSDRTRIQLLEAPRGSLVAVATFGGLVDTAWSSWATGPVRWRLDDVRCLQPVIPCRGAQGLWNLPPDVEARVLAQIT